MEIPEGIKPGDSFDVTVPPAAEESEEMSSATHNISATVAPPSANAIAILDQEMDEGFSELAALLSAGAEAVPMSNGIDHAHIASEAHDLEQTEPAASMVPAVAGGQSSVKSIEEQLMAFSGQATQLNNLVAQLEDQFGVSTEEVQAEPIKREISVATPVPAKEKEQEHRQQQSQAHPIDPVHSEPRIETSSIDDAPTKNNDLENSTLNANVAESPPRMPEALALEPSNGLLSGPVQSTVAGDAIAVGKLSQVPATGGGAPVDEAWQAEQSALGLLSSSSDDNESGGDVEATGRQSPVEPVELQIRRSDMPKPLAHGDGFHGGKVSPLSPVKSAIAQIERKLSEDIVATDTQEMPSIPVQSAQSHSDDTNVELLSGVNPGSGAQPALSKADCDSELAKAPRAIESLKESTLVGYTMIAVKSPAIRAEIAETSARLGNLKRGERFVVLETATTVNGSERLRMERGWISRKSIVGDSLVREDTSVPRLLLSADTLAIQNMEDKDKQPILNGQPHVRAAATTKTVTIVPHSAKQIRSGVPPPIPRRAQEDGRVTKGKTRALPSGKSPR
eukprot:SAG31_NODE_3532_length_4150_cov_1.181437_2_plen_564_part_01